MNKMPASSESYAVSLEFERLANHEIQAHTNLPAQIDIRQFMDSNPVPTFVINKEHIVTHWNRAAERVLGYSASMMVYSDRQWLPFYKSKRPVLADLVLDDDAKNQIDTYYAAKYTCSTTVKGAFEAEDFFPHLGESGLWLHFTAAPLFGDDGQIIGAIETLEDITERRQAETALRIAHDNLESLVKRRTAQLAEAKEKLEIDIEKRAAIEAELISRNAELTKLNSELSRAQEQLLQSEKLASIGQLAAGVAHEINNPIGYIFSNFGSLENYIAKLFEIISAYEHLESHMQSSQALQQLIDKKNDLELDYLKNDIPELMQQSKDGIDRVRKIVQDLKDFSRVDAEQTWQWANLHQGIDSTLNIVNNETKYKADIIKEYGDIPEVECLQSQINQVIMNLVVNACHAMEQVRGKIMIRTYRKPGSEANSIVIEVEDNGSGIPADIRNRIFDPFFTTKPIGKGTGLGLSLSYGIIQKHAGQIMVDSEIGKGTCFRIILPIRHEGE